MISFLLQYECLHSIYQYLYTESSEVESVLLPGWSVNEYLKKVSCDYQQFSRVFTQYRLKLWGRQGVHCDRMCLSTSFHVTFTISFVGDSGQEVSALKFWMHATAADSWLFSPTVKWPTLCLVNAVSNCKLNKRSNGRY